MEVLSLSPELNTRRETFFRLVFGPESKGYVCLAFMSATDRTNFWEEFYSYPAQLPQMIEAVNKYFTGYNVYFCPQILNQKKRTKESVSQTPNAWADLDTCTPEVLRVPPSVIIESSPDRYQAYWVFESLLDPDDAEDISRRIAYGHADEGADRSGWDLTQLLRVPFTYNYKYTRGMTSPIVEIVEANRKKYRLDDFKDYTQVGDYEYLDEPLPTAEELDANTTSDDLLQVKRQSLNPRVWSLYAEEPPPGADWSKHLWNLQMLLFEAGYERIEVFKIVQEAKCNKYVRDGKSIRLLWKDICRGHSRYEANQRLLRGDGPPKTTRRPLMTDAERALVAQSPDTFIERYMTWAKSLGDAAVQYHQAGAFVVLSSLLAGTVRLPTSFGVIKPNLWFMILADTTLTRKSTAMDIAMDLVLEIDPDCILATDGSIEGLMGSLSTRPGRPSVFLRDEFSGLLEMISKKDYYAGMPEVLTKLYDGKFQKRILRKETIEVRDPCLIIFAGGIRNKITSILTFEQVSSGFMPRFIFITAESDPTKLRPLGPPTQLIDDVRASIREELEGLVEHYKAFTTMVIENKHVPKATVQVQRSWDAELTPEAWLRYNQLEAQLVDEGLEMEKPDIMTPVHDRLSKSILKCALLLAASRQRGDTVLVEEIDILRATMYGEQWKLHAHEVMASVGKGTMERTLDLVMATIRRKPGCSRSLIMQYFHLTARQTNEILDTLEQRGHLVRERRGRTELLNPLG